VSNCLIVDGNLVAEEVEVGRFVRLENEVKHVVEDISEIKDNQKETTKAIASISESMVKLTAITESNQKNEPRIKSLEDKVEALTLKIAAWSAFASGAWFVIGDKMLEMFKV